MKLMKSHPRVNRDGLTRRRELLELHREGPRRRPRFFWTTDKVETMPIGFMFDNDVTGYQNGCTDF